MCENQKKTFPPFFSLCLSFVVNCSFSTLIKTYKYSLFRKKTQISEDVYEQLYKVRYFTWFHILKRPRKAIFSISNVSALQACLLRSCVNLPRCLASKSHDYMTAFDWPILWNAREIARTRNVPEKKAFRTTHQLK